MKNSVTQKKENQFPTDADGKGLEFWLLILPRSPGVVFFPYLCCLGNGGGANLSEECIHFLSTAGRFSSQLASDMLVEGRL